MTQTSKSLLMLLAGLAGLGALYAAESQALLPEIEYEGPAFTFTEIRDDVWVAIGTGNLTVMSNAGIIINDDDVMVIDSHVSPAAAEALLEELKQITTKPVRYVVNSHGHFDHAHGNQIYPSTIEVIGHEYAHRMLASGASNRGRTWERYIGTIPGTIERLRAQLEATTSPAERETLERRLRIQESFKEATDAVIPTPPNLTLNDRMTLYRGGREIRIEFFGRAHTGGDVVVYLPEERIVFTGDLIGQGISYLGDAFVPEYVETLELLKSLDFETIVPGHGRPFNERERIDHYQAYLADFWLQVSELYAAGVSAADAARRIDMRAHAEHYPTIRSAGVDNESVDRAYELLAGLE